MFKKLFSIKKQNAHKIIRFLGVKVKYLSKSLLYKKMQAITPYRELAKLNVYLLDKSGYLTPENKKIILGRKYYEWTGEFPNLTNPKKFNEKINWMKIYYDNPLERRCVDKYEFKKYIDEILGEEYTIPVLGVYENVDMIDFDSLPNKFVIKSTVWGGGTNIEIIKDKTKVNLDSLKYRIALLLYEWQTVYYATYPKFYEGLKPRIIIEEYMPIREGKALEYKFFCFHGEVKFCLIECDYFGKTPARAFYDKNFDEMPFSIGNLPKTTLEEKPANYDKMVELAEKLSKPFPFVRVDFYDLDGKIYVGEFTFTSGGGFSKYNPKEWDYKFGEWLDLNKLEPEYLIKGTNERG